MGSTQSPDAKHVRAYARSQGMEVGVRGTLDESLWRMWAEAGYPFAAGGTKPEGWQPAERNPNGNRPIRVSGRKKGAPPRAKTEVVGGFHQPVAPTEDELDDVPADALVVELVVSGHMTVLTKREADWFNATKAKYLDGNAFDSVSDAQDLDRLLALELQVFRLGQWLAANENYQHQGIDIALFQKQLKDLSAEIARLKDSMGLSLKARQAQSESVAEKWADVLRRAKKWDYHRRDQVRLALLLMNQLSTIVLTYDRSDDEERRVLGYNSLDEIFEWVRDEMLPKYAELDEYFRVNEQSTWVRGQ